MYFEVKGKEYKLNFGVKFVVEMDKTMIVSEHGVEFGMGTVWAKDKLTFGSFETLADVIRCAILDRKFTQDDIINELDKHTNLLELFNEIEGELKNSQAVQTVEAKLEALEMEENRRKAVKKHTSK